MGLEASGREDPTVCGRSLALRSTIADCPGPIAEPIQVALVVGRPWGREDLREAGPDHTVAAVGSPVVGSPVAGNPVAGSPVAGNLGLGVHSLDLVEGNLVPVVGIADVVAVEVHLGHRMNRTLHDHREMHRQARREKGPC
jgi:hypothetical protein